MLWRETRYFDEDAFANDRRRILRYYEAQGYYGAKIASSEVLPDGPGRVKVVVRVEEGKPTRVAALDRWEVPEYYVAAVVFHEMLHQVVPALERNGRRVVHGAEFRRRERAYPDHARARAWEEENLDLLLSHGAR